MTIAWERNIHSVSTLPLISEGVQSGVCVHVDVRTFVCKDTRDWSTKRSFVNDVHVDKHAVAFENVYVHSYHENITTNTPLTI